MTKKVIYDGKNCPEATCKGRIRRNSLEYLGYDCLKAESICEECELQLTEYFFLQEVDIENQGTYEVENV